MNASTIGMLAHVCVLGLGAGAALPTAASEPIPAEHFFGDAAITAVELSPDGRHMAFGVSGELVVLNLESQKIVSRFRAHEVLEEIGRIWWVSNERLVCNTILNYPGRDVRYLTGDYYAADLDGSQQSVLVDHRIDNHIYEMVSVLRDDPEHILMQRKHVRASGMFAGNRPEWVRVNVYQSRRRTTGTHIQHKLRGVRGPLGNGSLFADQDGNVRIAVGHEDGLEIRYRDDNDADWRDITNALGAVDDDAHVEPLGFTDAGERFYFLSNHEGGTSGLYLFDPADDSQELVYRHDQFDLDSAVWNADRERIVAMTIEGNYPLTAFLDPDDPETQVLRDVTSAFSGRHAEIASIARDGRRIVLQTVSDRHPGQLFLYDHDSNAARFLYSFRPELEGTPLSERRPFVVETPDGLSLHGYMTLPVDAAGASPLLVLPHGGPHGVRNTWAFDNEAQFFASRGYAVLQVNFRGSGGYGRSFEAAGYRQWGDAMIDDILLATRWAKGQPNIDDERACLYGASFGGYAAMMAAIRGPDLFDCAIGLAGVYDLELMYGEGDIPQHPGGTDYLERAVGRDVERLHAQSPVHQAHRLQVPVLIAHGGRDRRAPVEHAERLRDALDEHDVAYEWHVESGEGHGFYDEDNRVALYEDMLAFLQRHATVATAVSTR